jgi:hypothetical protein
MKKIIFLSIITVIFFSCKKYEEDKSYSTYTAKSRLVNKGVWQIIEVEDLETNSKISAILDAKYNIKFNNDNSYIVNGNLINSAEYFKNYQFQFSQFLKPIFINQMQNKTDSIIIGYGDKYQTSSSPFEFKMNKQNILLKNFISFGNCWGNIVPHNNYFQINNSIDLEFKIKQLEFGYLTLSYNDRLIFKFKKILVKVP